MPLVAKIDELGKPAWIALMVLGFAFWWPIGLATLAFMIGSGRMSSWRQGMNHWCGGVHANRGTWWEPLRSSGNRAFDDYRAETLRRLEEEQREFKDFLKRLRMARDKQEFDQFMAERRGQSSAQLYAIGLQTLLKRIHPCRRPFHAARRRPLCRAGAHALVWTSLTRNACGRWARSFWCNFHFGLSCSPGALTPGPRAGATEHWG